MLIIPDLLGAPARGNVTARLDAANPSAGAMVELDAVATSFIAVRRSPVVSAVIAAVGSPSTTGAARVRRADLSSAPG